MRRNSRESNKRLEYDIEDPLEKEPTEDPSIIFKPRPKVVDDRGLDTSSFMYTPSKRFYSDTYDDHSFTTASHRSSRMSPSYGLYSNRESTSGPVLNDTPFRQGRSYAQMGVNGEINSFSDFNILASPKSKEFRMFLADQDRNSRPSSSLYSTPRRFVHSAASDSPIRGGYLRNEIQQRQLESDWEGQLRQDEDGGGGLLKSTSALIPITAHPSQLSSQHDDKDDLKELRVSIDRIAHQVHYLTEKIESNPVESLAKEEEEAAKVIQNMWKKYREKAKRNKSSIDVDKELKHENDHRIYQLETELKHENDHRISQLETELKMEREIRILTQKRLDSLEAKFERLKIALVVQEDQN